MTDDEFVDKSHEIANEIWAMIGERFEGEHTNAISDALCTVLLCASVGHVPLDDVIHVLRDRHPHYMRKWEIMKLKKMVKP